MKKVNRYHEEFPSSDFNFFNLENYWEVSKINPDIKLKVREIDEFKIIIIDDFLLNPEGFSDFLKKFPGFPNSHRSSMSRPGYSQKFHPELFRHFEQFIFNLGEIKKELNFTWATNIMHSNMKLHTTSMIPHWDTGVNYVMNYWMCEGINNTSISFYEFNGNKRHLTSDLQKSYDKWTRDYASNCKLDKWKNFECDKHWKKYYSSKVKYNRVVFYDPYFYHAPFIEKNSYLNEYRYSLVGFGKDVSVAY